MALAPALLLLIAGALLIVAPASAASPALYAVFPCNGTHPAPGIEFEAVDVFAGFDINDFCDTPAHEITLEGNNETNATKLFDRASWALRTPAGTSLQEVDLSAAFLGRWDLTSLAWVVSAGGERVDGAGAAQNSPVPGSKVYRAGPNFDAGTRDFNVTLGCFHAGGCAKTPDVRVDQSALRVVLADEFPPIFTSVDGPLLRGGPREGMQSVTVNALDQGSGIVSSSATIDGFLVSEALAGDNGGKCHEPFEFLEPCSSSAEFLDSIDTTQLSDGAHFLQLKVKDAAGNLKMTSPLEFDVHNAPTNSARPSLTGTAKVGGRLAASPGVWSGSPVFAYQWLRCPAAAIDHTQCLPISAASGTQYDPVQGDANKRLIVEVSAVAKAGAVAKSVAFSAPSPIISAVQAAPEPVHPGGLGVLGGRAAPQTKLVKHPHRQSTVSLVRFAFSSDQADSHFECKLDRGAFRPCESPSALRAKRGGHVFAVRAVNPGGLADRSPASFRWTTRRARVSARTG